MGTKQNFIDDYLFYAKKAEEESGINHLFILAQAALESGWGKYVKRNNFFGVKSFKDTDQRQLLTTTEYSDKPDLKFPKIHSVEKLSSGRYKYKVDDWFKWYKSPADAFVDHVDFFFRNKRYKKALEVKNNPVAFAFEVAEAGYATDPDYANKLVSIMKGLSPYIPQERNLETAFKDGPEAALTHTNEQIELLESYSKFLEEEGYMDADWYTEEPFAIDTFLALTRKKKD